MMLFPFDFILKEFMLLNRYLVVKLLMQQFCHTACNNQSLVSFAVCLGRIYSKLMIPDLHLAS